MPLRGLAGHDYAANRPEHTLSEGLVASETAAAEGRGRTGSSGAGNVASQATRIVVVG